MKHGTYQVQAPKKPSNIMYVKVDASKIPNRDRLESRLRNKAVTFEDRRFKKPKHKPNYQED